MNGAIIYSSRYGSTKKCAQYLEKRINAEMKLIDIDNTDIKSIDIPSYDMLILGSSIYIGAISKTMKEFCKVNSDILKQKVRGIFVCCASVDKAREYIKSNFSSEIIENAAVMECFGGEANIDTMKTLDRIITKIVTKGKNGNWKILEDKMDGFIQKINQ